MHRAIYRAIRERDPEAARNAMRDHLMLAQDSIIHSGPALVHLHAQRKVRVVVDVRSGADNPVHKPGLDQRNQTRNARTGRRQRSGKG